MVCKLLCFLACVENEYEPITSECVCHTNTVCNMGEYCYGSLCKEYPVCIEDGENRTTEKCKCGSGTCGANLYCFNSKCSAKPQCNEDESEPLAADCTCSRIDCVQNKYCYDELCRAYPKCNAFCCFLLKVFEFDYKVRYYWSL